MNDRALKLLEQYDLEILATRRGRGSYICETSQGLRILSDYSGSEKKALFANKVMGKIREGGYEKVDMILPDKEGKLINQDWEGNKYVLKEWYVGRECDTGNENEILMAVGNLAHLHRLMHLEQDDEYVSGFYSRTPRQEMQAQNALLRKIRSFVRRKNDKRDFERNLLKYYEKYYDQAREAEEMLCNVVGDEVSLLQKQGNICHGDYNHHHILMSGYDIATTNFENCKFDFQVNDLYRFMRKILEKHDWNERLGMRMLDRYLLEHPLSKEEKRILYVKMLYPEKFRKLAGQYYGSNKAWISKRYNEKLEKLNFQEAKRNRFIQLLERQIFS